jgi:hypothetical protein
VLRRATLAPLVVVAEVLGRLVDGTALCAKHEKVRPVT